MAPVIRISDDTFLMLQKIAQPLVDTPDTAIRRALAAYLASEKKVEPHQLTKQGTNEVNLFIPDSPPNLTHTSFLGGKVGAVGVNKWNYLLLEAHAQAYLALGRNLAELQKVSEANIRKGNFSESGFKPVGDFGFSIQGVEANKAWGISLKLAKKFKFPISIEFRWQQKEGAAFPGEVGRLAWKPSN